MLTDRVPLSTGASAVYPWNEGLADQFRLVSRFEEPFNLFRKAGKFLHLPREGCPRGVDKRDPGRPFFADACKHSRFKPRHPEQERVIQESCALLREDKSHVIQAPTGWGKTVAGVEIALRLGRRAMIVTTKEDIIQQWIDTIDLLCGTGKVGVSVWRGDSTPKVTSDFVVGLVQSVMKGPGRYPASAYSGFGLLIADECHRMSADQFSQAMWWFPAKLRLGMSATTYRKDGKGAVFLGHLGPVLVKAVQETMIPRIVMRRTTWKVPRVFIGGKMVMLPHKAGRTMHLSTRMAVHPQRNRLITSFTKTAWIKGRYTIIFADTIAHLQKLEGLLVDTGIPPGDIGYYVGSAFYEGTKAEKASQREAAKKCRVILATYSMASEATDIPRLDACVLAGPRSDVIQIVGRIRRTHPGKKQPIVLDLVDGDSPLFEHYWTQRRRWYRSLGCEIRGEN